MEQQIELGAKELATSWYGLAIIFFQVFAVYWDITTAANHYKYCNWAVIYGIIEEAGLNLSWLVSLTIDLFIISAAVHVVLIWLMRRPLADGRKWARLSTMSRILLPFAFLQGGFTLTLLVPPSFANLFSPYTYVIEDFAVLGWVLGALLTKLVGLYLVPFLRNSILVWGIALIDSKYVGVVKKVGVFNRQRESHAVQQELL